jgi:hypothetical protein
MSVRILNKEKLGNQSYLIIYIVTIALIIIFLIMIGILIIYGFKNTLPPDLVNEPPTDLAEEQEDDN